MKQLFILIILVAFSYPSFADRVNRRQMRQNVRAAQGVANGSITRSEARRLNQSRKRVRRAERRAKRDGEVTAREKRRLENMQDKRSEQIKRFKHNDRNRPNAGQENNSDMSDN